MVSLPQLAPGDTAKMKDAFFAKRYPGEYEVAEVKGKYAYLKLPKGVMGFSLGDLVKVPTKPAAPTV